METKRCTKCGVEKPITEFYKESRRPDGLRCICKTCANRSHKIWRSKNKERYNASMRNYYAKRKEKILERQKEKNRSRPDEYYEPKERYPGEACYLAKARKLMRGEVVDPHCGNGEGEE